MDVEKLIESVRLCGSTPKVDQCKQCAYWSGGDMSKCIPRMTTDAATALSTLQTENEKLRDENRRWSEATRTLSCAIENLRAELEQVKVERDAYQVYFKDLSSKPDCNTCEKRNCDYRPKLGATVRANCPLYSGPQKED